jgi:hypothetical protein
MHAGACLCQSCTPENLSHEPSTPNSLPGPGLELKVNIAPRPGKFSRASDVLWVQDWQSFGTRVALPKDRDRTYAAGQRAPVEGRIE